MSQPVLDACCGTDDDVDCDCSEYDVDIFLGTAWCPRCQRSWGLSDAQLKKEIEAQADYMRQFECAEENPPPAARDGQ